MQTILDILGLSNLSYIDLVWVFFGTLGQMIFFSRWIIQWYFSEKFKSSIIPVGFWWCSLSGGIITLMYAYHIASFPFMIAQMIGILVYLRNLILIYKDKNEKN